MAKIQSNDRFGFIYTRDFPKNGLDRPWQDGDEPLSPFEKFTLPIPKVSPQQRIKENLWYDLPDDTQERADRKSVV